ncbi:hypothetical protein C8A05DRAFT_19621, partial [Staphylotrichum tortipilum]
PAHGWGAWGYTILRTVYTPEADALLPVLLERLRRVVRYWCHYTRFPAFGACCAQHRVDDGEPNEELFRRFFLEVVEDREGLAHLDRSASGEGEVARFTALAEYFRRWCQGVDTRSDTGDVRDVDPRFASCLVVDSECLAALAQIDVEPPPLRCAATREEKADIRGTGYPAWLWLLEARYIGLPAEKREQEFSSWLGLDKAYPGWLRVEPRDLYDTWSDHWRLNDGDRGFCLMHEEVPKESGVYVYHPL